MQKRMSPAAVMALKEALCCIYWYKSDLRGFLQQCLANKSIVAHANWDAYKRQIVSDIIDALCANQDRYLGDLLALVNAVCEMRSFKHLERLEDGRSKAQRAREAVQLLREMMVSHQAIAEEEAEIERRRQEAADRLKASQAVQQRLDHLRRTYAGLLSDPNAQKRGLALERLFYDVFELFDLDPKASFRHSGEQIDGAFTLAGTDYLFEAKWQTEPVNTSTLGTFRDKVERKLDNTLGLFFSMNGFSKDAVDHHSSGRSTILLLDGAHLMAILEGRIDFVSLLTRIRRHAAQTGRIYLPINEM
jgi:hypothetical protein